MASLIERLSSRVSRLRERHTGVDHVVRTVLHYAAVNGNGQAGAVTFFGFLSFFPILALAFFAVGYVSAVFPDLRREVAQAFDEVLPGMVGNGDGEIPLSDFEKYAGTVGLVGLAGLLYSGLGWLSGMRSALAVMFVRPEKEQPGFVVGKLRDLRALLLIGVVLLLSVGLTGAITWFSEVILGAVELEDSVFANVVLWLVGHGLAVGATAVLFVTMFRLLAQPRVPSRALWQGGFVGAVGFELLKSGAGLLISQTKDQPAFQAFGVSLILLVWINYFSRLVMLSAAWAQTSTLSDALRSVEEKPLLGGEELDLMAPEPASVTSEDPEDAPLPRERHQRGTSVAGDRVVVGLAGAVGVAVGAALAVAATRWRETWHRHLHGHGHPGSSPARARGRMGR